MPTRREFLEGVVKGGVLIGGTAAAWAFEQKYHWLFPTIPACSDETDPPDSGVFEFSGGPNTTLLEPSVFLTNNLLVIAAIASTLDSKGKLVSPLPIHTWVADINTRETHHEVVMPANKVDRVWGSDPVIAYIPETHQAALISIAIEKKDYPLYDSDEYLALSLFDINTKTWKSHQKLDLAPQPKKPDKPWLYWDTYNHQGHLVCYAEGHVELFSCDQSLQFKHQLSYQIPDKSTHSMPIAFPTGSGIEIIFFSYEDEYPIRAEHIIFDPDKKTVTDPKKIFRRVSPNPFIKRFSKSQLDKTLSGLVTPQRGICLTSASENNLLVGYKAYDKPDWKTLEMPVRDVESGVLLQSVKSVNPQVVGPNTIAVTFLAYEEGHYDKNRVYSLLLDETESGLVPRASSPIHGPYPCTPYPSEIVLGDYSQILSAEDKTAFVSLQDHKLRVKVMPQLR